MPTFEHDGGSGAGSDWQSVSAAVADSGVLLDIPVRIDEPSWRRPGLCQSLTSSSHSTLFCLDFKQKTFMFMLLCWTSFSSWAFGFRALWHLSWVRRIHYRDYSELFFALIVRTIRYARYLHMDIHINFTEYISAKIVILLQIKETNLIIEDSHGGSTKKLARSITRQCLHTSEKRSFQNVLNP